MRIENRFAFFLFFNHFVFQPLCFQTPTFSSGHMPKLPGVINNPLIRLKIAASSTTCTT